MYGVIAGQRIPYDQLTWEHLCDPRLKLVNDNLPPFKLNQETLHKAAAAVESLKQVADGARRK